MLREGTAPLIRREDYAAPAFWIRSVELTFDLDGAKTLVASKLRIERNHAHAAQPLRLHGDALTLLRVMADGESVAFRHDNRRFAGDRQPARRRRLHARDPQHLRARQATPSCRACTPPSRACSRNARRRASAASPTSSTGPT